MQALWEMMSPLELNTLIAKWDYFGSVWFITYHRARHDLRRCKGDKFFTTIKMKLALCQDIASYSRYSTEVMPYCRRKCVGPVTDDNCRPAPGKSLPLSPTDKSCDEYHTVVGGQPHDSPKILFVGISSQSTS